MSFRRSHNDLAYGEEIDSRVGNRWDRDRFERVRAKSRPRERDSFKFEEDDRWGPRGGSRDIDVDERFNRRGSRGGWEERRFFEDDRYTSPRKSEFFEDERYRSGKEVAPYMHRFEREPPPRPSYVRRQSSWDAHDRRPYREEPYYGDRGGDRGGGERQNNDLRLNIRMGSPDSRSTRHDDRRREFDEHISIDERDRHDDRKHDQIDERISINERDRHDDRKRDRFDERINIDDRGRHDDWRVDISERRHDEPRYPREPEPRYYRDPDWREREYDDYHGARIIRERERRIDRRARSPPREIEPPHEEESRETETKETFEFKEEVKEERPPGTKKGKTRMPKRLVHRQALLDLGFPFDEEVGL